MWPATTMSSLSWQNLPDHIFGDIMMMINLQKIDRVLSRVFYSYERQDKFADRCRQVCRSWNLMVMHMAKHKKDTIRKKLETQVNQLKQIPNCATHSVSLKHHGLLDSVEELWLWNVDLTPIPAEHLVSLISCVTKCVKIVDVRTFDIVTLLDSVQCVTLSISSQNLSTEETWALVRAMDSNVEVLELSGEEGDVTLDFTVMSQYSGQGKCNRVMCYKLFKAMYEKQVKSWAQRIKWVVFGFSIYFLTLSSNQWVETNLSE